MQSAWLPDTHDNLLFLLSLILSLTAPLLVGCVKLSQSNSDRDYGSGGRPGKGKRGGGGGSSDNSGNGAHKANSGGGGGQRRADGPGGGRAYTPTFERMMRMNKPEAPVNRRKTEFRNTKTLESEAKEISSEENSKGANAHHKYMKAVKQSDIDKIRNSHEEQTKDSQYGPTSAAAKSRERKKKTPLRTTTTGGGKADRTCEEKKTQDSGRTKTHLGGRTPTQHTPRAQTPKVNNTQSFKSMKPMQKSDNSNKR